MTFFAGFPQGLEQARQNEQRRRLLDTELADVRKTRPKARRHLSIVPKRPQKTTTNSSGGSAGNLDGLRGRRAEGAHSPTVTSTQAAGSFGSGFLA
jgi:hypothetical protein